MLVADRYECTEVLGHGGMGEVWLARDNVLGRTVAVKLLVTGSADEHAADRFQMEAQTAGRLSHPNVVAVLDFGTFENRLFLVMEPLDGRTVANELADNGPLPPERVASIGAQVASGLAAAHQQGILHRDVKPANLLLAPQDRVKIGDFGIARFTDKAACGLTRTGQVVGTSLYLAPERVQAGPAVPASDVYALGCVLYELLIGRPPLSADTPLATLHQHLTTMPDAPRLIRPEIDGSLDSLIMAMLAKDPTLRPSAEQVTEALAPGGARFIPAVGAAPVAGATSTLPGATVAVPAQRRSHRTYAAAGTALLVAAAAVVLAFLLLPTGPTSSDHGRTGTTAGPTPSRTAGGEVVADPDGGSAAGGLERSRSRSASPSGSASASASTSSSPTKRPSPKPTHSARPTTSPTTSAPSPTPSPAPSSPAPSNSPAGTAGATAP